jgi:hypothetical protein
VVVSLTVANGAVGRRARGNDYNTAETVYQIGFLDFTLFEDHPEFFARYQMRNDKDSYLYTDKFNVYVISRIA